MGSLTDLVISSLLFLLAGCASGILFEQKSSGQYLLPKVGSNKNMRLLDFLCFAVPRIIGVQMIMLVRLLLWWLLWRHHPAIPFGNSSSSELPPVVHLEAFTFVGMGNIARFEFLLILREFLRTSLHGYNREKESHVWVFSKLACWCTLAVLVLLAVVAGITAKLWAAEASTVMFGIHSAAMTAYFYYILQLVDNQMTVAQVALKTRQRWHAENRSGAEHTSDSGASMSSAQTRDLDLAARIKRERCILGFARYGIILVYMGFIIHFLATSHLFRGDVDSYVYDVPFYSIVSYCIFYIVISFLLAIKFHVRLKQALRELCRDFERQSLLPRAPDRAVLPGAQPVRELQPLRNSNVPREQLSASDNLREPPAHDSRMPPAPANPMEVCPDSRELPAPPPISHDHVVLQQLEAGAFDRGPSEEIQADGFHRVPSEEDEIQPGAFDRASSAPQEGKMAPGRLEIVSTAGSKSIDVDAVDNTQLRALIDYYGTRPLTQYKKLNTQKTQSQSRLPSLLKSVLSTGYSFAEDV